MALPHQAGATLEVLDTKLEHVQGMLERILAELGMKAPRSEVEELRASVRSLETRVRTVEDDRTSARAVLAILGTLVGLFGVGGLGAALKWMLTP